MKLDQAKYLVERIYKGNKTNIFALIYRERGTKWYVRSNIQAYLNIM